MSTLRIGPDIWRVLLGKEQRVEHITGTFRREGRSVAEDAEVFLYVDVSIEPPQWFGSFELPTGAQMSQPGDYEVDFADGRHGAVTVSLRPLLGKYQYGGFTGNGPLHEPASVS